MQTRSQQDAKQVYDLVASVITQEYPSKDQRKEQKKYGALCHRFPLIVRESGLAAAFGFLAAKGATDENSPENLLLRHYAETLGFSTDPQTMQRSIVDKKTSLAEYRRLTLRTLKLAEWFKRYAEGILKVDATGESTEEKEDDSDAT